jgi:outer membrane protein OmpA-like peptidoglycan-associated protein
MAPGRSTETGNGAESSTELDALRKLLVGPSEARIDQLSEELRSKDLSSRHIADRLPEAIALSGSRGEELGRALSPTIDTALRESIRRDPREVATAIFPVLGPAIRKAIAEAMSGLVRSINSAVEESLSVRGLKWRVEAWRSGVPYPQVVLKHALIYRVEQAFLVHAETGLLLVHVAARDLVVQEAELVSSMLSAIQDFVHDSFMPGEDATLRTFSVGDRTVQVEAGPRALLAVVIRGEAPGAVLEKQQDALETVHLEFASQLAEFSGDSAPFAAARPLLEDCLETVLSTDKSAEKRRGAWLKWAVPLGLVVLALAVLFVRSSIRWNKGIEALRAEPGIVVVDATRGWRDWRISGLKDPLARNPQAVVSAAGVGDPHLTGRWEAYMSLDPVMVRRRTSRSLDSLTRALESQRILFATASANLDAPAIAQLSSAAAVVHRLDELARSVGGSVRIGLTGRTDMTGASETNATLARQRVAAVSDFLASAGIDRSRLIPDPVATAKPLRADSEAEQARINRSVSFNVALSAPSSASGGTR